MKKLLSILFAVILLSGSIGCLSTPAKSAAKAFDSIATSVDMSMKTAGVLYAEKKISEEQKTEILSVYAQYQQVARTLLPLLKMWNDSGEKPATIDSKMNEVRDLSAKIAEKVR